MTFFKTLPAPGGLREIMGRHKEIFAPWGEMGAALMRGPSPLSEGERELIAAYVSAVNACEFCYGIHSEIAVAHGVEDGLLKGLLDDLDGGEASDQLKALLRYVRKLTLTPSKMTQRDVDDVLAAGCSELALQHAIFICCRFNFMNRLVDGFGLPPIDAAEAKRRASHAARDGYFDLARGAGDNASARK